MSRVATTVPVKKALSSNNATSSPKKKKLPNVVGHWESGTWVHHSEQGVKEAKRLSKSYSHQELEQLLEHNTQPWTFLTAHHKDRNPEQNQSNHQRLYSELQARGYNPIPVTGHYTYQEGNQNQSSQEPSYLIPGMATPEAIELGHRYGQESVLTHEGVFNVENENMHPIVTKKVISGEIPKTQDQSIIHSPSGQNSTFLLNADWQRPQKSPKGLHPHLSMERSLVGGSVRLYKAVGDQGGTQVPQGSESSSGGSSAPPKASAAPVGNSDVRRLANAYTTKHGLGMLTETQQAPVNEERAKRMADHYVSNGHNPNDPDVQRSYAALKHEINQQYEHAQNAGYTFTPWGDESQPYRNSKEMMADVRDNKHLGFFTGGDMPPDHPLSEVNPEHGLTYNDQLRAIHDLFGHSQSGFQFGPMGEDAAWKEHKKMFTRTALPALTQETRMQNSTVNYGSHLRRPDGSIPKKGEEGYIAPQDRPYAPQHANLPPPWALDE